MIFVNEKIGRKLSFLTAWETVVSQESFIIDVSGRRFCIVLLSEFRMWLGIILSNEWHYLHFISFHFMRPQSQVFIFSPVRLFSFCFFLSELASCFSQSVSLSWALSPYFELSRLDGFSASFASRLWKENLRERNAGMQCDLRFAAMFYIGICQYSEVTQFRVSTAIE